MTKKILFFSFALLLVFSNAVFALNKPSSDSNIEELSYSFFLYYDNGQLYSDRDYEIKFDVLSEKFTPETINEGQLKFKGEILNFKNEIVKTFEFDPQKGDTSFKTGKITVKGPYIANGLRANFYDNNGVQALSVFVSAASICNDDGSCSAVAGENEKTCPSDCKKARTPIPTPAPIADTSFLGGGSDITLILIYVVGGAVVAGGAWFGWRWYWLSCRR